jgi:hypothetical protein
MSDRLFVFNLGVEDARWSSTMYIFLAFIYVMSGITFASKYLKDKDTCDPTIMTFVWMFSWILGKQSEEKIQKCISKDKYKVAHFIQNPIVQKLNDAQQSFNAQMAVIKNNTDQLQKEYDKSEGKVDNLAIAIQKNILAIKSGMQKVVSSIMVNNYIRDGALTVVKNTKNYDKKYEKAIDAVKK